MSNWSRLWQLEAGQKLLNQHVHVTSSKINIIMAMTDCQYAVSFYRKSRAEPLTIIHIEDILTHQLTPSRRMDH
jgi:hypothetical protein